MQQEVGSRNKRIRRFKIGGIRLSALCEASLMILGLLLADRFLGTGNRFMLVQPSPFWIPLLLITVHYGTVEGIFTAMLCTAALLCGNLPELQPSEDLFTYWGHVAATPLVWFCTTVVLGEITQRHRKARKDASSALVESQERERLLVEEFNELRNRKQSLETELASFRGTPGQVLEALRDLDLSRPENVLFCAQKMMCATLGPKKSSVYLTNETGLILISQEGWKSPDEYKTSLTQDSALYRIVVESGHALCIAEPLHEQVLKGQGILVAPITNPFAENSVIGILKIEEMDLFKVHLSSRMAFEILGELIGQLYGTALLLVAAPSSSTAVLHELSSSLKSVVGGDPQSAEDKAHD